ncbi:MAG TPA: enolase C-terminal domain-like protein [Candidatus Polarisedimenticolia bacterium]|jgi:L-alanine-DL-glutamate epimerase-like enolase superfamily enzyme|nr:enolase C-terminal domain-like protein [Candidatus Polarisedimenticolia bacterium]
MSRIVAAEAVPITFRLVEGYRIAGRHFKSADNVLLKLVASDGRTGYGCGAPMEEVTGEHPRETLRALNEALLPLAKEWNGDDTRDLVARATTAAPRAPAARAALDMALCDIDARRAGVPLARLLGSDRTRIATSFTFGIEDDMTSTVERARRRVAEGFHVLKIKVGEDWKHDLELIRALRAALGPGVVLRADGNEGYDEASAAAFLRGAMEAGLELLEQPVPKEDLGAMARLATLTRVPIMADESVQSEADAERLIEARAANLFNIKLMKSGGVLPGLAIARRAAAAGIGIMVGCNDESRISIAAGLHLALAAAADSRADLDGHLDLQDDVATGGFRLRDGTLEITGEPGLGVEADF